MMKKIIIILISIIILLGISIGTVFLLKDKNKDKKSNKKSDTKEEIKEDNQIVSTIILDINPSVEINLDKDELVISVKALNADAKKIINDDLIGKSLDNALETITDNLILEGFASDEIVILISTSGDIKVDDVKDKLAINLEEKNINYNIISQDISESAKEISSKYDISDAKASYIEEILEDHEELTIDDLKDKNISELKEIKNKTKEEIKEPEVYDEPVNQGGNGGYPAPPSDPTDKSGVWCTWNRNRPPEYEYYYRRNRVRRRDDRQGMRGKPVDI